MSRFYDLAAFTPRYPQASDQSLVRSSSAIVGIYKLSQRYIVEFLTGDGSVAYQDDRGTGFWSLFRTNRLRTEADVFAAFLAARTLIGERLQPEVGDPLDESYAGSELTSVEIQGRRRLILRIVVRSQAGTSLQVSLPIAHPEYRNVNGAAA